MFEDSKILALIPARGGSKGVPHKNLKELAGRPLIAYTILAARGSRYIDSVVVTTDDLEIARVAREYGAEVPFMRPAELAQDTSKSIDAVVHACAVMAELGRPHDVAVLLQPTSPLRGVQEIDEAIETFFSHGCLGLASVSEVTENPILTRRIDDSGVMHPLMPVSSTVRRQDMPKFWHVDGAIYINRTKDLNPETSFNDNPIAYVMPQHLGVDIDDIEDFRRAEKIMRELEHAGSDAADDPK